MAEEKRETGVVSRWLNGYGFIKPDAEGKADLFVYRKDIQCDDVKNIFLQEGQEVEFCVAFVDEGNMKAVDVTLPGGGTFDSSHRRRRKSRKSNRNGSGGGVVAVAVVKCNNCGGVGHTDRVCPSEPLQKPRFVVQRACHTCGDRGHLVRECPRGEQGGVRDGRDCCYNCGKKGHFARDCLSGSGEGGRGGAGPGGKIKQETRVCYGCGKTGHIQMNCKEEAQAA